MKTDAFLAAVTATVLLATAGVIVFIGKPGGFETQIGYFLVLLPGFIPSAFIDDALKIQSAAVERAVFWSLFCVFNFGWYFILVYVALKVRKGLLGRVSG